MAETQRVGGPNPSPEALGSVGVCSVLLLLPPREVSAPGVGHGAAAESSALGLAECDLHGVRIPQTKGMIICKSMVCALNRAALGSQPAAATGPAAHDWEQPRRSGVSTSGETRTGH